MPLCPAGSIDTCMEGWDTDPTRVAIKKAVQEYPQLRGAWKRKVVDLPGWIHAHAGASSTLMRWVDACTRRGQQHTHEVGGYMHTPGSTTHS